MSSPPAGWYQNPEGPGQRYWDGQQWLDMPAPPRPPERPRDASSQKLWIAWGIAALAILLAIIGFASGGSKDEQPRDTHAQQELSDARATIAKDRQDARDQVARAHDQVTNAQQEIDDARAELGGVRADLRKARRQLTRVQGQVSDEKAALKKLRAQNAATPTTPPDDESGRGGSDCDSNYEGACIPTGIGDVDCSEIPDTDFRSVGTDPDGLDRDGDGIACES